MNANQLFAAHIRKYRKAKSWSQEELASRAGLHRTYIGAVERCEKNITLLNAERIARALEVALVDCLKDDTLES